MSNDVTEQAGIAAVIAYEAAAGRKKYVRVSKCGYDLKTSKPDDSDERHIEVKATEESKFYERWLEKLEEDALRNDQRFFLYLVTEALTPTPKVYEYDLNRLMPLFSRPATHYFYRFPKEDFEYPDQE